MKPSDLVLALALASASLNALADSSDAAPDTHWKASIQVGTVHENGKYEPIMQDAIGYEFDSTWSVEALFSTNLLFMRSGIADPNAPYEFDSAYGARVLATVPLGDSWSLVGGLGLTKVHDERGLLAYGRDRVGALVSAAAMYRINRRWSVGLEASSFTQSSTLNLGLRGEIHF